MTKEQASRRRRYDPARKERIVTATMRVLADQGIEGFSLREVAGKADVPVGSLSYHFADREDLLTQVSDLSHTTAMDWTRRYFTERADEDLPTLFGEYIEDCTVRNADRLRVDYQLLAASANHPGLRKVAESWRDEFFEILRQYADESHAWALFYMIEGMLMQSVVHGTMFFCQDVRPIFAATLAAEPARATIRRVAEPIEPVF